MKNDIVHNQTKLQLRKDDGPQDFTITSVAATFIPATGVLSTTGDGLDNNVVVGRSAGGALIINGGAIPIVGGVPTVANTRLIQMFGLGGNDVLSLDERNGALPSANLFGGAGEDVLLGGPGLDILDGGIDDDVEIQGLIDFAASALQPIAPHAELMIG